MTQSIDELRHIMAQLRDPERGCPWDQQQTFQTVAPYTLEEAHEVADAISRQDWSALREELGDLLLQVVFHSQIAAERQLFDFDAVVAAICAKMVRRHPHVFGELAGQLPPSLDELHRQWDHIKAIEKAAAATQRGDGITPPLAAELAPSRRKSIFADLPTSLPAIHRALKLQKRAAKIGFDWLDAFAVMDKVTEELAEVRECVELPQEADELAQELGDLLFACVNLCRKLHCDPEMALMQTNAKFEMRIRRIESLVDQPLSELTDAERDILWQRVKAAEKAAQKAANSEN